MIVHRLTKLVCRYHPGDIKPSEFKDQLRSLQEKQNYKDMPKLFIQLRERFNPVMRHFFTEKRQDPLAWYAMRLRYARSLAVGSMAGHTVGLGDRHCSNILVDQSTGELVHIDLGIAFEQVSRCPNRLLLPSPHVLKHRFTIPRTGPILDNS